MTVSTPDFRLPALGERATFELESLQQVDDVLRVTGYWKNIDRVEFARPRLLVQGVKVDAMRDEAPWDPLASPWTATFPWSGQAPEASDVRLDVGRGVAVDLVRGTLIEPRFTRADRMKRDDQLVRIDRERARPSTNIEQLDEAIPVAPDLVLGPESSLGVSSTQSNLTHETDLRVWGAIAILALAIAAVARRR